jgi:hypothetical protein
MLPVRRSAFIALSVVVQSTAMGCPLLLNLGYVPFVITIFTAHCF